VSAYCCASPTSRCHSSYTDSGIVCVYGYASSASRCRQEKYRTPTKYFRGASTAGHLALVPGPSLSLWVLLLCALAVGLQCIPPLPAAFWYTDFFSARSSHSNSYYLIAEYQEFQNQFLCLWAHLGADSNRINGRLSTGQLPTQVIDARGVASLSVPLSAMGWALHEQARGLTRIGPDSTRQQRLKPPQKRLQPPQRRFRPPQQASPTAAPASATAPPAFVTKTLASATVAPASATAAPASATAAPASETVAPASVVTRQAQSQTSPANACIETGLLPWFSCCIDNGPLPWLPCRNDSGSLPWLLCRSTLPG
jgi:hypothetical protein